MKTEHAADKAQEWTEDRVQKFANDNPTLWPLKLAKAINASITAERESDYYWKRYTQCAKDFRQLREQLAAAQAKCVTIKDSLNQYFEVEAGSDAEKVLDNIEKILKAPDTTALDAAIEKAIREDRASLMRSKAIADAVSLPS